MRARWNAFVLSCALVFPAAGRAEPRVVSSLEDVFPQGELKSAGEAKLEAAAGEWESFQIVVKGPLREVRAEASPIGELPAPRLMRVGYLEVKTPSSQEGRVGMWPDPLIPDVDAFVGEKRRAFPFDVPAGEQRAIWVDVFVPPGIAAGVQRGRVRVIAREGDWSVPLSVTVHHFELPRSSSLPVTYGISAGALAKAHGIDDPALLRRYGVAALRDRISLHGGTFDPPIDDFRAYDAEVAPFLDGNADPGGPADAARWTAIDVRVPYKLDATAKAAYLKRMVAHLRARGWLDRAFFYVMDEPSDAQLGEARRRAEELALVAPEIPRLVTRAWHPELAGVVDRFCPVLNFIDDKPGNSVPHKYTKFWWYQACMSHGCDDVAVQKAGLGAYFTGWPNLVIDAPPMAQRIQQWLSWRYRAGGELYFNTVEAYAKKDPWQDQYLFTGNGDGTLFYPGTPKAIGGKTHVPVESIRLKRVRDGLEDYEYLRLHEQRLGRSATDAIAKPIAGKTYEWQHDVARVLAARHQLAEDLDRAALSSLK
jgi:hypothetical protein